MKKIIIFSTLLLYISICCAQKVNIQVTFSEDFLKKITSPQWVYWYTMSGNECEFTDSCLFTLSQKSLSFEKEIGLEYQGDPYFCRLIFAKEKLPVLFFATPGADIKMGLNNRLILYPSKCEGDITTQEIYQYNRIKKFENFERTKILKDSLSTIKENDVRYKLIADSIHYYENYYKGPGSLELFKIIQSPTIYSFFLKKAEDLPQETIDSLEIEMKKKFPYSKSINNPKYDPPSIKSKKASERFDQITNRNSPPKKVIPPEQLEKEKKELDKISSLALGDEVKHLSLKGMVEKDIALDSIKTDYILIDFWAGWCGPCRKEIPNLKKALSLYDTKLTIYAISLDFSEDDWKKAVRQDESESLTHVFSNNGDFDTKKLKKRFGITAIPANFLLDKDRKIIAVNLRGDALEKKMKELVTESLVLK